MSKVFRDLFYKHLVRPVKAEGIFDYVFGCITLTLLALATSFGPRPGWGHVIATILGFLGAWTLGMLGMSRCPKSITVRVTLILSIAASVLAVYILVALPTSRP